LMLLMFCVSLVRLIFRVLDAAFPKYMERAFKTKLWGSIYSLNPLSVIVCVPIIAVCCWHRSHLFLIKWGALISSLSAFFLCIRHVAAPLIFVIVLSVGESLYSPRLYQVALEMSPVGVEGMYTALASAPMFVAKLTAGPLSGFLLNEYCSVDASLRDDPKCINPIISPLPVGSRYCDECPHPAKMWGILGCIALIGTILLFLTQKIIQPEEVKVNAFAKLQAASDQEKTSGGFLARSSSSIRHEDEELGGDDRRATLSRSPSKLGGEVLFSSLALQYRFGGARSDGVIMW